MQKSISFSLKAIKFNYAYRSLSATCKTKEKCKLPKMNAWQIHSFGDISELQLTQARIPIIDNPDEILVKVEAASLNPIDNLMINGYGRTIINTFRTLDNVEFPLTLGRDFSGKILAKGHNVEDLNVGDDVYGVIPIHKQGSQAEFVISEKSLTRIRPINCTAVEATSVLYAAMTAWSALWLTGEYCLRSPRNSKILILGASGGVGTVAVQMLKSQDACVVSTCSTDAVNLVQSLGSDYVFDYKQQDCVENVGAFGKYDVILDCAKFGIENVPSNWNYSKFITLNSPLMLNTDKYGLLAGVTSSLTELLAANLSKGQGKSVRWGFFAPFSTGLSFIDDLLRTGKITPIIHKVFKFSDIKSAYESLQAGQLRGKIVVEMD